jgi:hypothetical protein
MGLLSCGERHREAALIGALERQIPLRSGIADAAGSDDQIHNKGRMRCSLPSAQQLRGGAFRPPNDSMLAWSIAAAIIESSVDSGSIQRHFVIRIFTANVDHFAG